MREQNTSRLKRFIYRFNLSTKMVLGCTLLIGILLGIGILTSLNVVTRYTNTDDFCISCHEMRDNIFIDEYKNSKHFTNHAGIKVSCSSCHIPQEFTPKAVRKLRSVKELWGHLTGVIGTPEKFTERRAEMAKTEQARIKASDSQECRNCHDVSTLTKRYVSIFHTESLKQGQTCIDCHKGIAHRLRDDTTAIPQIDAVIGKTQ